MSKTGERSTGSDLLGAEEGLQRPGRRAYEPPLVERVSLETDRVLDSCWVASSSQSAQTSACHTIQCWQGG